MLSGLSFVLKPGDCLSIKGPNGVGKTTLIRTLAGLSSIAEGTLAIPEEEIAYVGHLDAVNPHLTVNENLMFWKHMLGTALDQETIQEFGLLGLGDRPAEKLSSGQMRRLSIAAAVASNRRILLLDEPFTSLDSEFSSVLQQKLARHVADGAIVVMSQHSGPLVSGAIEMDLTPYRCQRFVDGEAFGERKN